MTAPRSLGTPSTLATCFACLLTAATVMSGCQQEEHVILLEVVSPEDLRELHIEVIPLDGRGTRSAVMRPVNQTVAQMRETPVRVAMRLAEPRDVMVHLWADSAAARTYLVGQRCMTVSGVVRDSVWLVPLSGSEDVDGDRFPTRAIATCARPNETRSASVACTATDPLLCSNPRALDCDDDDDDVYPGAPEICADRTDQDCDGDDASCEDADGDGFSGCRAGDPPGTCDCNDADPDTYPDAPDSCLDPTDSDCDGFNDLCDADCDGYPAATGGTAAPYTDCDDESADTHPNVALPGVYELADGDRRARGCEPTPMTPAASDMCTVRGGEVVGDGVDQDCNGFIDDGMGCTDTTDRDRDGSRACVSGMTTGCDTNDCDPGVSPARMEICGNGFDEDGDGVDAPCDPNDLDQDGQIGNAAGGPDCDDTNPRIFDGAPEDCRTPASESCRENVPCTAFGGDPDNDGFLSGLPAGARGDCEDRVTFTVGSFVSCAMAPCVGSAVCVETPGGTATCEYRGADIHPFAAEDPCDGIDNDCDGIVDEVLRAPDATAGRTDGCVRTGGGAAPVDYHLSARYSEYCGGCGITTAPNEDCCSGATTAVDTSASCGACDYDCGPNTGCARQGNDADGDVFACTCAPDASGDWADCDSSFRGPSGGNGCETDLDTNPLHCGACNNACGINQACVGGMCMCTGSFLDCDGALGCEVNGSSDVMNCGRCTNRCSFDNGGATCSGGVCRLSTCATGFDNCDGDESNGCENPLSALGSCGRCGESCGGTVNATEICSARVCDYSSCDTNFNDCDSNRVNGCETNITNTLNRCGNCGTDCNSQLQNTQGAGRVCSGAVCNYGSCSTGWGDCDGTRPNGCETNTTNTLLHCGGCGMNCNSTLANTQTGGRACSGSSCNYGSCLMGFGDCDSVRANGCETNTASTLVHCGGCGMNCNSTLANTAPAGRMCTSGACDYGTCNAGYDNCDSMRANGCETNLNSSLLNCGACGTSCNTLLQNTQMTGRSCNAATCDYAACSGTWGDCDGTRPNGCETNTASTVNHCGGCGNDCNTLLLNTLPGGRTCAGGSCAYAMCVGGFDNCDGIASNGCESSLTALDHCGNCATNCNTTLAFTMVGGRMCSAGVCDYGACLSTHADCNSNRADGCETPLRTTANCNTCGHACGTGETCGAGGACTCGSATSTTGRACPTGMTCSGGTCV